VTAPDDPSANATAEEFNITLERRTASYARKSRPDQHRDHLWRQGRNRFVRLVDGRSAKIGAREVLPKALNKGR
jgi:hypothetical protein